MQKIKIFFLIVAIAVLTAFNVDNLNAQTFVYSEYEILSPPSILTYEPCMISNVVVSSPNGVNYMINTDEDRRVYVCELDYSYPTPQPVPSNMGYFQLPQLPPFYGITFINGIYTQKSNYDEIFLWGYDFSYAGMIAVIRLVSGVPTNLAFRYITDPSGPIYNGYPYPQMNANIMSVAVAPVSAVSSAYAFVVNGILGRIQVNNGMTFLATPIPYREYANGYKITSVAYDAANNNFVVSFNGSTPSQKGVGYINSTAFVSFGTSHLLTISPNTFQIGYGSYKVHVPNNYSATPGEVYLVHDLFQTTTNQEGLWITKMNYLTGIINTTRAIMLPFGNQAITVLDVEDDFYTNLQILAGTKTTSSTFNFMLQTGLASLSPSYCRAINNYNNNIHLRGMNFNRAYYDVFAYGANNCYGYLVEVSDLAYAPCVNTIQITQPTITVSQTILNPTTNTPAGYPFITPALQFTTLYNCDIVGTWLCGYSPSPSPKSVINNNPNGIKSNTAEIHQIGNNFICSYFEGNCDYKITDILGRILQDGTTQNNVENTIRISNSGVYFISVTDENKNVVTSKIIITE